MTLLIISKPKEKNVAWFCITALLEAGLSPAIIFNPLFSSVKLKFISIRITDTVSARFPQVGTRIVRVLSEIGYLCYVFLPQLWGSKQPRKPHDQNKVCHAKESLCVWSTAKQRVLRPQCGTKWQVFCFHVLGYNLRTVCAAYEMQHMVWQEGIARKY